MITIKDTDICAFDRKSPEHHRAVFYYRNSSGTIQAADLDACAKNYKKGHPNASTACAGERDITGPFFVFYTDIGKLKVHFQAPFIFRPFKKPLLSGFKTARFQRFQSLINSAGYTTYDLS